MIFFATQVHLESPLVTSSPDQPKPVGGSGSACQPSHFLAQTTLRSRRGTAEKLRAAAVRIGFVATRVAALSLCEIVRAQGERNYKVAIIENAPYVCQNITTCAPLQKRAQRGGCDYGGLKARRIGVTTEECVQG